MTPPTLSIVIRANRVSTIVSGAPSGASRRGATPAAGSEPSGPGAVVADAELVSPGVGADGVPGAVPSAPGVDPEDGGKAESAVVVEGLGAEAGGGGWGVKKKLHTTRMASEIANAQIVRLSIRGYFTGSNPPLCRGWHLPSLIAAMPRPRQNP